MRRSSRSRSRRSFEDQRRRYCLPRPVSSSDLAIMGAFISCAHAPRSLIPATRAIRICCAAWRLTRPNQVRAMDITYIPMARGFGTMCSSRGRGAPSSMSRCICALMKPSAQHAARLAATSASPTAAVPIRALTAAPRIKPTSPDYHSARQLTRQRLQLSKRVSFQTIGTSSVRISKAHGLRRGTEPARSSSGGDTHSLG